MTSPAKPKDIAIGFDRFDLKTVSDNCPKKIVPNAIPMGGANAIHKFEDPVIDVPK